VYGLPTCKYHVAQRRPTLRRPTLMPFGLAAFRHTPKAVERGPTRSAESGVISEGPRSQQGMQYGAPNTQTEGYV
jgi:hypothetical protein